ncbi:hypothetical protein [Calidifontibacillus oryziterrae]|uniref:hypothetical protein n=1 Tax=Calidifontibacillus oryziterrae TaxID=1191699 RepID=UPI0002D7011D|nr:hypothetical protein [Calidifontibacillus oryziterrae]
MALMIYLFIGFIISGYFFTISEVLVSSKRMFIFLTIGWFPLFILGIVLITFYEPHQYVH